MTDRICTKCSKTKPTDQFQKVGGLSRLCEDCRRHGRNTMRKRSKELRTEQHKAWRHESPSHKAYMDNYNLIYHTGLTREEFDKLHEAQEGKCAICQKVPTENDKRLHVDHNHQTLIVRGLLCHKCNTALGLFDDDIERMLKAVQYLKVIK